MLQELKRVLGLVKKTIHNFWLFQEKSFILIGPKIYIYASNRTPPHKESALPLMRLTLFKMLPIENKKMGNLV